MKGDTKWEEAWRAFDADIQSAYDAQMFVSETKTPIEIFDSIAEEFNVTSSRINADINSATSYERAWRRLGAWIYRNEPNIEQTVERYGQIIDGLDLNDETWSEITDEN
jgi:hypothetical protein